MNNNDIFHEFWRGFQWPDAKPVSYRLYHNESGDPIMYTMEDLPGKYVEVTADQYAKASFRVKVISGVVHVIEPNRSVRKLRPAVNGTPCHPRDITIVVDVSATGQCWKKT